MTGDETLKPCPFCGGPVSLERATDTYEYHHGRREWWGVVCRNTANRGGSCAIQQLPSASKEAAIDRWNMRPPAAPVQEPEVDLRTRWPMNGWKENKVTPPAAQRPWVGLTDEEIQTTWDSVMDGAVFTRRKVYKAIETKLKEKNNAA